MKGAEVQDYEHTNIYHYIVEFKTAFIDTVGSFDTQNPPETGTVTTLNENVVVDFVNLYDKFDFTFDNSFNFYG